MTCDHQNKSVAFLTVAFILHNTHFPAINSKLGNKENQADNLLLSCPHYSIKQANLLMAELCWQQTLWFSDQISWLNVECSICLEETKEELFSKTRTDGA